MYLKPLKIPGINISLFLFAILSFWSFSFSAHNRDAWHLLMSNKPLEAREAFQAAIANKNIDAAKDAYIGLAFTNEFLGEETEASRSFFKGCMLKYDPVEAYNGIHFRMAFCRLAESYSLKEGYKFFKSALKKPGMFNGSFSDELVERYMADGKIKDAWKIASHMGVIRNWKCIGPFENISNSGFNVSFPPENELDFSKLTRARMVTM